MRNKRKRPTDGGGNWMDTYGDMVTLLLTFFIMLFAMSNLNEQKWEVFVRSIYPRSTQEVQEQVSINSPVGNAESEMEGTLDVPETETPVDIDKLYLTLAERMNEIGIDGVTVSRGEDYTFIVFEDKTFFDGDSSILTDQGKTTLDVFCDVIGPAQDGVSQINIMAHTAQALYGAIACGLAVGGDCLTTFAASALLALATKNFCRSYCNGFGFDAIFRASLYIGLLPLVATAAAPLLILLPLAVMLFRRTLREVAVAVAGLLLPALTLCYVNWAAGGEFLAQVAEPGSAFIAGTPLSLFLSTPVQNLVLPGAVFLLDLTALLFFLSDIYALGTKPRLIFIFNISALLLTAAALCGPAATPATVALAAVPSAVLLPFMFVRIHRAIALPLYLLLLASAVISAVLQ